MLPRSPAWDRNIGRVIAHLKETKQFTNTIVLYHHDNGGCHVEYGPTRTGSWTRDFTTDGNKQAIRPGNIPGIMPGPQTTFQSYGYGWANASNTPFRLFKQYDHEGGTRSPLIVSWPDGLAPEKSGAISKEVCHAIDLMPTLLSAAGVDVANFQQKPTGFEGRSFLSEIKKGPAIAPRTNPIFWAHAKGRAIRDGKWKLVADGKGDWELYDLEKDGTELNDLASKMPEKVSEMEKRFKKWQQRISPQKINARKKKK